VVVGILKLALLVAAARVQGLLNQTVIVQVVLVQDWLKKV
jgi:hypothetical protein